MKLCTGSPSWNTAAAARACRRLPSGASSCAWRRVCTSGGMPAADWVSCMRSPSRQRNGWEPESRRRWNPARRAECSLAPTRHHCLHNRWGSRCVLRAEQSSIAELAVAFFAAGNADEFCTFAENCVGKAITSARACREGHSRAVHDNKHRSCVTVRARTTRQH